MKSINLSNFEYINEPFAHCVIENFFDENDADILHNNIISLKMNNANSKFIIKDPRQYNKFGFSEINKLPLPLQNTFIYLNSKEFVGQIEKITGISNIIYGDYNLRGAGVHMIKKNGYLNMHTDFNSYNHPVHGLLDRRVNLLIYMNKDWKTEYKGNLLLYHPNDITKVKSIKPIFNRAIIFNTTNKSIHGHPEPLNVPNENIYRKSIAVYYYTKNTRGNVDFEGVHRHSTLWHKSPKL